MADLQQQLEESSSDGDPDFDENEKEQENIAELQNMEEQQRYRRLQHLLEKSSIYSMFLLQRMNNQRDEDKRAYRRKTRTKKVPAKDTMQENFTKGKTYSLRRKRQASEATVSPAKQTSQSKRKRIGCKDTNYKIENYIDEKGHLRKSSAAVARHIDDTSASQEEEEEEDADEIRMIDNKEVSSRQPLLFTGGVMRGYQLDGMEWLKVLFENGVNGILGDEMGLGKTVQCIGFIAHLVENGVKGPYLVVGPLSTLPNWCSEFQRFTPEVPVVLYHGNQEERELLRRKHFSSRKRTSAHSDSPLPVVITSYEMCLVDRKFFQCQEWKYLVVDEGQRIKNLNCKLIQTLKTFKAANRLLLTGTPLQNNLAELWSLLNFLLPDIFDDLNCFQQYFDFTAVGEHSGNEKILAQEREQSVLSTLHQILTPFLLRRLKSDVELKIPPKKEVMVYAPISPLQAKLYKAVLEENILDLLGDKNTKNGKTITVAIGEESKAVIGGDCPVEETPSKTRRKCTSRTDILMKLQSDDHFMGKLLEGEASYSEEYRRHWFPQPAVEEEKPKSSVVNVSLLGKTMQLRKCINHPYLIEFPLTKEGDYRIDEDIVRVSGKMLLLDKLLAALLQRGHKTLIFSQMTRMLDLIEDYVEMRGIEYGRLDGSMSVALRQEQIRLFNEEPSVGVFLISTRAGGLGVNLTAADTVIIYDSDWNPQADLQAQDRCHRIGQNKPVVVYRFVTANTIDQHMVETAASKRMLEKMVIHKGLFKGHNKSSEMLTLEHLKDLLEGGKDHDKVFDSGSTSFSISDETMKALLDRTYTVDASDKGRKDQKDHTNLFRVVKGSEEQKDSLGSVNVD